MISFCQFNTRKDDIALTIYGSEPHRTTNTGLILGPDILEGLREFLREYGTFVNAPKPAYYRIDAYFSVDRPALVETRGPQGALSGGALSILEVNASFVDGWGIALNLVRANGLHVNRDLLRFPKFFTTIDPVYLPELRLFVSELKRLGVDGNRICDLRELGADESAYVYGRLAPGQIHYPMDGKRIDDKMNLALFSREWGDRFPVRIPYHHVGSNSCGVQARPWGFDRRHYVFKFCDKSGPECQRYRSSVVIGKPPGKNRFLRQCYESGRLVVQEYVRPTQVRGEADDQPNNCQLVILAIDDEPVTGYVQYSPKEIINDNSTHGPLALVG